jgi:LysW-gamma-L-lysine carboxypeptidase
VDTVSGNIPVRREHNILYGRGTVDAKGSLAVFLEAASSITPRHRIVVVGAVDEEGESRGARHLLSRFNPAAVIIGEPSGWDSITIGYKGRFSIEYSDTGEPTHSSLETSTCIEQAITFINTLQAHCNSFNKRKNMFNRLGMRVIAIHSSTDGLTDSVSVKIIFRTPMGFQLTPLQSLMEMHRGTAHIHYSSYDPPVKASKTNGLVSAFVRSIRMFNGQVSFKLKSGTSDMNILQAFTVPLLAYGPGDSRYDHTPHEQLNLAEYEKSVSVLREVLQNLQIP